MTTGSTQRSEPDQRLSAGSFHSLRARLAARHPIDATAAGPPIPGLAPEGASGDPFANAGKSEEILQPDVQSGETGRALLDIMSAPSGNTQPHERGLAADLLERLVPRLPLKNLLALVERVAMMETPPQPLVRRLIRDPRIAVSGPLLERASTIADQDLIAVVASNDMAKQRMIARRRTISQFLAAGLIEMADPAVLLTLVRNPGASLSIDSFHDLCATASSTPSLQAPLVTRNDTPAQIAFELFWHLPPELRRYVLSRFLSDSENLNRIVKIVIAMTGETKPAGMADLAAFLDLAAAGAEDEATQKLIDISGFSPVTARRIVADREGEPLAVIMKVLGVPRNRFAEAVDQLQCSDARTIRANRNPDELGAIFDSLSFNKARVVMTYWEWTADSPAAALRHFN